MESAEHFFGVKGGGEQCPPSAGIVSSDEYLKKIIQEKAAMTQVRIEQKEGPDAQYKK